MCVLGSERDGGRLVRDPARVVAHGEANVTLLTPVRVPRVADDPVVLFLRETAFETHDLDAVIKLRLLVLRASLRAA